MDREWSRLALEALPEGSTVLDEQARFTWANPAFLGWVGRPEEELIGLRAVDLLPGLPEIGARAEIVAPGGGSGGPWLAIRRPLDPGGDGDGPSLLVLRSTPADDRSEVERQIVGEITHALAVSRDLDELLRLVHASLRRVVNAENLFVALHDEATDSLTFPYFVDLQDENPHRLPLGRSCTAYVLRTGRPMLIGEEAFEALAADGEVELVGSWSPSWMGVPLRCPDRTLGVLAMQHYEDEDAFSERDLELCATLADQIALAIERRLKDEGLRRSRALLANIVETMHDGVMVLDERFRVVFFNRGMERITSLSREAVLDGRRTVFEVLPYLADLGIDDRVRRAQQGEAQDLPEVHFVMPDGRRGVSHDIYLPLRRLREENRGVLALVRDVTEAAHARSELQRKEAELQHAQKMEAIGRLAGGVAHDFNNLLTAINGFAEILLAEVDEESPLREPIGEIHTAGTRAAALTQKLLALSRKQVVQATRVDLNELVGSFEPILRRMIGTRVDVVSEIGSEPRCALVDPLQLEQILLNLAVNAADAMPSGGRLTVRVVARELGPDSAEHPVKPGQYVGLEVEDSGVGMEERVRSRIFEPFFTTKEQGRGTGLGLAIVYGIVKQNYGYIWIESEPGVGTVVRLYFPQVGDPAEKPETTEIEEVGEVAAGGSETILLVEDEGAVRSLVTRVLSRAGYQVVDAAGPTAALEAFAIRAGSFDLVVSDVVMPRVRGPELVEQLRRQRPDLPVLYISGHLGEGVDRDDLIGDDPLLVKPFTARDLLTWVAKILDR